MTAQLFEVYAQLFGLAAKLFEVSAQLLGLAAQLFGVAAQLFEVSDLGIHHFTLDQAVKRRITTYFLYTLNCTPEKFLGRIACIRCYGLGI